MGLGSGGFGKTFQFEDERSKHHPCYTFPCSHKRIKNRGSEALVDVLAFSFYAEHSVKGEGERVS